MSQVLHATHNAHQIIKSFTLNFCSGTRIMLHEFCQFFFTPFPCNYFWVLPLDPIPLTNEKLHVNSAYNFAFLLISLTKITQIQMMLDLESLRKIEEGIDCWFVEESYQQLFPNHHQHICDTISFSRLFCFDFCINSIGRNSWNTRKIDYHLKDILLSWSWPKCLFSYSISRLINCIMTEN